MGTWGEDWKAKKEAQSAQEGHLDPAYKKGAVETEAGHALTDLKRLSKVKKPKERVKPSSTGPKRSVAEVAKDLNKVEAELSELKKKKLGLVESGDEDGAAVAKKEETAKASDKRILEKEMKDARYRETRDFKKKARKEKENKAKKEKKKKKSSKEESKETKTEESTTSESTNEPNSESTTTPTEEDQTNKE